MKIVLNLILILTFLNGYSISDYDSGDSLYVLAFNGLIMHEKPNSNSELILLVPYGERVTTLSAKSKLNTNPNSVVEIPSRTLNGKYIPEFRLKGEWCKVQFKGNEGYVFDAYLSKLHPIEINESYFDYIERNFKRLETQEEFDGIYQGKEMNLIRISYTSGISYYKNRFTSWGAESIVFPDSFEEAYLLFIANKINRENPIMEFYGKNEGNWEFYYDTGGIKLKEMAGFVIIENEWGN